MDKVPATDFANYESALTTQNRALSDVFFGKELTLRRISKQAEKPLKIQSMGAIARSGSKGICLITDCSRPLQSSLNS